MFILANFIEAIALVIKFILFMYYWLILIRAIISWVNPDPFNPLVQFLYRMTEPVLEPIRRILPPLAIDVSPILAFMAIMFLQHFLVISLFDLAAKLK